MTDMLTPVDIQRLVLSNQELAALIEPLKALLAIEQQKDTTGLLRDLVDELRDIATMMEDITKALNVAINRQEGLMLATERAVPSEMINLLGLLNQKIDLLS